MRLIVCTYSTAIVAKYLCIAKKEVKEKIHTCRSEQTLFPCDRDSLASKNGIVLVFVFGGRRKK